MAIDLREPGRKAITGAGRRNRLEPRDMDKREEEYRLALEVVDLAKAGIVSDNHFLSAAIGQLVPAEARRDLPQTRALSTDARFLYIDSTKLLAQFVSEGTPPEHDLMHTILHCVFLHPFVDSQIREADWDLACDIACELLVMQICGPREGTRGADIERALKKVALEVSDSITAERVYAALRSGAFDEERESWCGLFAADDHSPWYGERLSLRTGDAEDGDGDGGADATDAPANAVRLVDAAGIEQDEAGSDEPDDWHDEHEGGPDDASPEGHPTAGGEAIDDGSPLPEGAGESPEDAGPGYCDGSGDNGGKDVPEDDGREPGEDAGNRRNRDGSHGGTDARHVDGLHQHGTGTGSDEMGADAVSGRQHRQMHVLDGTAPAAASPAARSELEQSWRKLGRSMSVNLRTISRKMDGSMDALLEGLDEANRQTVDYREFLRRFAVPSEVMEVSPDEFDMVFYTYGLSLYGNMPLIEPLENRIDKRIRDFVIAIDTSGSVYGEQVREFVALTYDVLKSTETFDERVRVRIVQCDSKIRHIDEIDSLEEVRRWCGKMRIYGGGGTDFRPVFEYVDELVEEGGFRDLGGLIYFTDGCGTYPERVPRYKTAFVFCDDGHRDEIVPNWAMQVVIEPSQLESVDWRRGGTGDQPGKAAAAGTGESDEKEPSDQEEI